MRTDAERSGINGAGTSTQKAKGITDNGEIFLADTLKGGAKKPEIAKVNAVGTYSTRGWGVGRGVRQCGAVWGGDERWRWALGAWGWLFTALFKKAQRRRMALVLVRGLHPHGLEHQSAGKLGAGGPAAPPLTLDLLISL